MVAWNKLNLIGQRFGELEVVVEAESNGFSRWLCKCDCGNTKIVLGRSLTSGNTKSCGCCRKLAHNWRGFGEITGSYWSHVKHNSNSRGKYFGVTIGEAWQVFLSQNRRCAISGVELIFVRNYMKDPHNQTASLDRIDSAKDYVVDNIQWVHKVVNKMKNILTDSELLEWCRIITENNFTSQRVVV